MRFSDLAYWPRQNVRGFFCLWQFNGPLLAARVTLFNLLRRRRSVQVRLHGFALWLRTGTPDLAVAIDSFGDEFAPLATLADPGGLIIDAGGYIGTAAMKLAALFPQCRIVCLEPAAENLELLRRNTRNIANVVVMQGALAAAEGEAVLHDAGRREWGFSMLSGTGGRALGAVPTVTVEGILAHSGCDELFLLKLDVEGAEAGILAASGAWMARTEILIAELHEQLAPGVRVTFETATAGRDNRRLPGEKMLSFRAGQ